LEPKVELPAAGPDLPESRFVVAETLFRFDHARGIAEVLCGDPAELRRLLDVPHVELPRGTGSSAAMRRHPSRLDYEAGVRRIKEHIRSGDALQVVLSQRAERPTSASAVDLYRTLRRGNPSPYLFLLDPDGLPLLGSPPE